MKLTSMAAMTGLLMWAAFGPALAAQAPGPTFDAVSIKRNTSGDPGQDMNTRPGRVIGHNITLQSLIFQAYGIRPGQVDAANAPAWVRSDHYDFEATYQTGATADEVSQMLQAFLADRFKLVVRRETRTQSSYWLGFARSNEAFGPALKKAEEPDCAPAGPSGAVPPATGGGPGCGQIQFGPGLLTGKSVTWMQIVNALSMVSAVGRPVVNGAGERPGRYDFQLRWRPVTPGGAPGVSAGGADVPDSIFTALQEQLGLKLNREDAAVEMVVFVDATRPEAN